jgi:hypothetical protein
MIVQGPQEIRGAAGQLDGGFHRLEDVASHQPLQTENSR